MLRGRRRTIQAELASIRKRLASSFRRNRPRNQAISAPRNLLFSELMKKQLSLIFGAAICLASIPALGVEPGSFSILGLRIGQSKSALATVGKFNCFSANYPNAGYDEICTSSDLAVDAHPVLMLVSLNKGLIVDLDANYQHADVAFFEAAVQTAIAKYGNPEKRDKYPRSEFVAWRSGDFQYSIVSSGSRVDMGILDISHPPIPPAPPAPAGCNPQLPLAIAFKPPLDAIISLIKVLKPSTPNSQPMDGDYRPNARIFVSVATSGVPTNVSISASSGNRDVDRALLVWARDLRFVARACPATAEIPFELHGLNAPFAPAPPPSPPVP